MISFVSFRFLSVIFSERSRVPRSQKRTEQIRRVQPSCKSVTKNPVRAPRSTATQNSTLTRPNGYSRTQQAQTRSLVHPLQSAPKLASHSECKPLSRHDFGPTPFSSFGRPALVMLCSNLNCHKNLPVHGSPSRSVSSSVTAAGSSSKSFALRQANVHCLSFAGKTSGSSRILKARNNEIALSWRL